MDTPASDWPRGAEFRAALIARCETWCAATGTPPTILGFAIAGDPSLLKRLTSGREFALDTYDRRMAALDMLDRLGALTGPLERPKRSQPGPRTADGIARKEVLMARLERVATEIGERTALVALAVTHDSTLQRPDGAVSDEQFTIYSARLDAIEAGWIHPQGGSNGTTGQATEGEDGESESGEAERHRREGRTVHQAAGIR